MSVLPEFIMPDVAKAANPAKASPDFSNFSDFSSPSPAENEVLSDAPLAAKLRAYGRPWPLVIDGEVKCWLVPDDEAAKRCDADEVIYTAAEVAILAKFDDKGAQHLHCLKAKLGGTIKADDDEGGSHD